MTDFKSNTSTPGYIESVASSKRHTKEDIKIDQIIPENVLNLANKFEDLLEAYYEYMNLEEYIYDSTETFEDIILDGTARFRIPDPSNENDEFFIWDQEGSIPATLDIYEPNGDFVFSVDLSSSWFSYNIDITNSYDVPDTIKDMGYDVGQTFTLANISALYNGYTAKLTTQIKNVVQPGPSYVLNTIETAMDIDENAENYLTMMQKELAPIIPRNTYVDKRDLLKKIIDFYLIRGTDDSIKTFFKIFYNEEVQVKYPWDTTLKTSDGTWNPATEEYIDNKGQLSDKIKLQDSDYYQKYSYVIESGLNIDQWDLAFKRLVHPAGMRFFGEIVLFIDAIESVQGDLEPARDPNWSYRSGIRHSSLTSKMPGIQIGYQGTFLTEIIEALASFSPMTAAMHLTVKLYNPSITANNLYNRAHLGVMDVDSGLYPTPFQLGLGRTTEAFNGNTMDTILDNVKIGYNSTIVFGMVEEYPDALLMESGDELVLEDGVTVLDID